MTLLKTAFYRAVFGIFDVAVPLFLSSQRYVTIRSGSFKGMKYGTKAVGSTLTPKLVGTYEKELAKFFKNQAPVDLVIDIGSAEGWYAVGLLYCGWAKNVVAYEREQSGHDACRYNAKLNNVTEALQLRGECDLQQIKELMEDLGRENQRTLVLVDCEGFENELFQFNTLSLYRNSLLLIETHDCFVPQIHKRLMADLAETHNVEEIQIARRNRQDFPKNMPGFLKMPLFYRLLMSERRNPETAWIFAEPKNWANG